MKKKILWMIFSAYAELIYADTSVTTSSKSSSKPKRGKINRIVKTEGAVHYGNILSEWEALKGYDADQPIDLNSFQILKKENWAQYTIEKFKSIPEFRQEKSLARIKKNVLQMLLTRNVPLSFITNFLTASEAGSIWRTVLDDMIHQPNFLTLHAADTAQVVHTLITMPLSIVDRKGLVLPIPDAYQDTFFTFYNSPSSNTASPKCLQDSVAHPDHVNTPPKRSSINGEDTDCFAHWVSILIQNYLTTASDEGGLKNLTARANLDALNQRILREVDTALNPHDHSDDGSGGSGGNDESSSSATRPSSDAGPTSIPLSSEGTSHSPEYHFDSEYISKTFEPEKEASPTYVPHKTKNFLDQLKGKSGA